jgi:biotin-(acetyl-CoA carboxylase) ligase
LDLVTDLGENIHGFFHDPHRAFSKIEGGTAAGNESWLSELFGHKDYQRYEVSSPLTTNLFPSMIVARKPKRSNLDVLSGLLRDGVALPHGMTCVALAGDRFLGRHDRSWQCESGNLHAVILFRPRITSEQAGPCFSILAPLACVDTIRSMGGISPFPSLKWVNDIFVEDRKVAGFLTRQTFQDPYITEVLLGIGVNVLKDPDLPENAFVPSTGCLRDLYPGPRWSLAGFLWKLLENISSCYNRLLQEGPVELLNAYRKHCESLGRRVRIFQDGYGCKADSIQGRKLIARGVITHVLDDLSLRIDGMEKAITNGRLAYEVDCA